MFDTTQIPYLVREYGVPLHYREFSILTTLAIVRQAMVVSRNAYTGTPTRKIPVRLDPRNAKAVTKRKTITVIPSS